MALARVVEFTDVDSGRIAEMRQEMEGGQPPEGVPVTEIIALHDADTGRALVILFFDNEDDYQRGHEALDAMPAGDTPGRRASVSRYEVAVRRSA